MAIPIKSPRDIEGVRCAGRLLSRILDDAVSDMRPGVSTASLNDMIRAMMLAEDAEPLMQAEGFPGAVSITINEEVTHAPPGPRLIREGQIVTVDAALRFGGWCADAARVTVVGGVGDPEHRRLAAAARDAIRNGLAAMGPGVPWSRVRRTIAATAEAAGFRLMPTCSGHGIGRALHEPPEASFAENRSGQRASACQDFVLRPGMVLTIEPVLVVGRPEPLVLEDAWTVVTADRSAAAHEEETVAVTGTGVSVLTMG